MSLHDLGTVRLYEMAGTLELFFPRGDTITRGVVKSLKGRWDPNRKAWKIDPSRVRSDVPGVIETIRSEILKAAPPNWQAALPKICEIVSTTKRFGINIGPGGVRIELPRGHKHEYTLKSDVPGAERDGHMWLLPADICNGPVAKGVIQDVINDDRAALSGSLDYLEGYVISGEMALGPGEDEDLGLVPEAVVFADPSFVRAADAGIPQEPLKLYPLRVLSTEQGETGPKVRLAFLTGVDAYRYLRHRLRPSAPQAPVLDLRHVKGKWSRRRSV